MKLDRIEVRTFGYNKRGKEIGVQSVLWEKTANTMATLPLREQNRIMGRILRNTVAQLVNATIQSEKKKNGK